jgi:hypothetical protein
MEFAKSNELNWKVRTESVRTESGIILPKYKAIVREDTNEPLSVMGADYQPHQNHEMIEMLERVSNQTGMEIKNVGLFGNGEKVFIQLKSDNLRLGDDIIEGYLTGINSFDGSTSLAFGPSNITISCTNSFFSAFKNLNFKFRHTKNMAIHIEDVCKGLDKTIHEEKEIFKHIVQLSETRVSKENIDSVIRNLFNIDKQINLTDDDSLSTVTKNKIENFYVDLSGEMKSKGGDNAWALFSGVTKYTTHSMNKGNTDRNQENKMFGLYGKRERQIFDKLVELV